MREQQITQNQSAAGKMINEMDKFKSEEFVFKYITKFYIHCTKKKLKYFQKILLAAQVQSEQKSVTP